MRDNDQQEHYQYHTPICHLASSDIKQAKSMYISQNGKKDETTSLKFMSHLSTPMRRMEPCKHTKGAGVKGQLNPV